MQLRLVDVEQINLLVAYNMISRNGLVVLLAVILKESSTN
jgi:hypothetical protein